MLRKLPRREFLQTAAVGTVGLAGILKSGCAPGSLSGKRPNIVLVTLDTQRYDRLGFNGYSRETSPFLDSIAEKGVVFDSNYSQSHFTIHSIASLLTSVYVRNTSVTFSKERSTKLKEGVNTTLAEMLVREGYQAFAAVSMPFLDTARGFARGFDRYSFPERVKRRGDATLTELQEMIVSASKRKPMFVWYHNFDPHPPYNAPKKFRRLFHTDGDFDDSMKQYIGINTIAKSGLITEKKVKQLSDQYDGQVLFADHNVEQLMESMTRQGLFDFEKDIFILTSDHGENLGEHGHCCFHNGLYETITHVPLVMAGAELPKGKRIDALAMNLDVAPTVVELVGMKCPDIWQGRSLMGPIQETGEGSHKVVYSESFGFDAVSARTRNLRYVHRILPDIQEETEKVDGFYPSGKVSFMGEYSDGFFLSWPNVNLANEKNTITDFELRGRGMCSFVNLFRRYIDGVCQFDDSDKLVYKGDRCYKDITSFLFGEDNWNGGSALDTIFEWSIRVFKDTGSSKEVLLDSGPIRFGLLPTPNFQQLYDVKEDHDETENLIGDPGYAGELAELRVLAERFMSGKIDTMSLEGKGNDLDKQEIEKLRTLGYV